MRLIKKLILLTQTPNSFLFLNAFINSKTVRILEYCNQLANPTYFFYGIKGMNKTKNIHNNNSKLFVASIALVVALALRKSHSGYGWCICN
jgi:hypothetical protein